MATDNPSGGGAELRAQPDKAAPNGDEPLTPAQHAESMKAIKTITRTARVNGEPETFQLFHWQHAAAEALHGWKQHEHHEAEPIKLSRKDYEAALLAATKPVTRALDKSGKPTGEPLDSHEAAEKGVPTVTDYEPHRPALSTHYSKAV